MDENQGGTEPNLVVRLGRGNFSGHNTTLWYKLCQDQHQAYCSAKGKQIRQLAEGIVQSFVDHGGKFIRKNHEELNFENGEDRQVMIDKTEQRLRDITKEEKEKKKKGMPTDRLGHDMLDSDRFFGIHHEAPPLISSEERMMQEIDMLKQEIVMLKQRVAFVESSHHVSMDADRIDARP
jgi:hypothetical protein